MKQIMVLLKNDIMNIKRDSVIIMMMIYPVLGAVVFRFLVPYLSNLLMNEYSFDNKITQLIRHTIEFIQQHKYAQGILNLDSETQSCVNQILQVTPSYEYGQRISTVNKNLKPFSHPYSAAFRG